MENQMRMTTEYIDGTCNLQVAKALALAASYYHGQDLAASDRYVRAAKDICDKLLRSLPDCVALRTEVSRLQLILLSGSEFEKRQDTINTWIDDLQEQMGHMTVAAPEEHACEKKRSSNCVETADLTLKETPFKNNSLAEVLKGMGSAFTRHRWSNLTVCLIERRIAPPMPIDDALAFFKDLLQFEGIWMANEDLGFLRPLFDLCFSVAVSAVFMNAGFYREAEHYMYVALIQLDGLNKAGEQPGGTKLEQLPSWLLAYVRLLFHVSVQAGRLAFACEVVRLEYILSQVLPRFKEHCRDHMALLQELVDKGVDLELPVLDLSTTFAPHLLPAAVGGPGVYVYSFDQLDPRFTSLFLQFPLTSLITTWLPVPQDPVALHTPGFFHLWAKEEPSGAPEAFVPSVPPMPMAVERGPEEVHLQPFRHPGASDPLLAPDRGTGSARRAT
mmetsp:Transcript_18621/g.71837  ORF Transcript_18621/g.71837 Transcript_18621/m.71837 type:complete len:444 (+) Transcript_18621:63-1394(+)